MRPNRLLVLPLVIFAFMKIAIASPSSAVAWPVTITVEKIAHKHPEGTKEVTFSREAVTLLGKIEISRAESNGYIRVSAAGASGAETAKRTAFYLSFYKEHSAGATKSAQAYLVGKTLVVPLEGGGGGVTCGAGFIYFVFLRNGQEPVVSRSYGSGCDADAFMTVTPKGALTLTTWSNRSLKVRTYRYTTADFVLASTRTPKTPAGYSPLISEAMPLKTKVSAAKFVVSTPQHPMAFYGRLYVNGVQQPLPSILFDGIAQKVLPWGDAKAVLLQVTTDEADGSKLQVLRVGKTQLRLSRLFGVKGETFPDVFYKQDGAKLDFEFVGYNWPCHEKDCAKGDRTDGPFRLYPITYQPGSLGYQLGSISLLGHGEGIMSTEGIGGSNLPLPAVVRRAYHNPPSRWFLLSTAGRCVPAHPRNPAALIRQDLAQSDLQDEVDVFERNGSVPVAVKVGEPESGDMETIYTFFRTKVACQSYASTRNQTLKSLQ